MTICLKDISSVIFLIYLLSKSTKTYDLCSLGSNGSQLFAFFSVNLTAFISDNRVISDAGNYFLCCKFMLFFNYKYKFDEDNCFAFQIISLTMLFLVFHGFCRFRKRYNFLFENNLPAEREVTFLICFYVFCSLGN